MRRRVAITVVGCVIPLGSGSNSFLEGLRAGTSGVRRITLIAFGSKNTSLVVRTGCALGR